MFFFFPFIRKFVVIMSNRHVTLENGFVFPSWSRVNLRLPISWNVTQLPNLSDKFSNCVQLEFELYILQNCSWKNEGGMKFGVFFSFCFLFTTGLNRSCLSPLSPTIFLSVFVVIVRADGQARERGVQMWCGHFRPVCFWYREGGAAGVVACLYFTLSYILYYTCILHPVDGLTTYTHRDSPPTQKEKKN